MNRQAEKGRTGGRHHVVAVVAAGDLLVDRSLAQFGVPHRVPRTGGNEARGHDAGRLVGKQHVAGQLFLDETAVGLVLVQRVDDIVAIGPGVGPGFVFVVAVRLAVVDHVQPMAGPTFAIAR